MDLGFVVKIQLTKPPFVLVVESGTLPDKTQSLFKKNNETLLKWRQTQPLPHTFRKENKTHPQFLCAQNKLKPITQKKNQQWWIPAVRMKTAIFNCFVVSGDILHSAAVQQSHARNLIYPRWAKRERSRQKWVWNHGRRHDRDSKWTEELSLLLQSFAISFITTRCAQSFKS